MLANTVIFECGKYDPNKAKQYSRMRCPPQMIPDRIAVFVQQCECPITVWSTLLNDLPSEITTVRCTVTIMDVICICNDINKGGGGGEGENNILWLVGLLHNKVIFGLTCIKIRNVNRESCHFVCSENLYTCITSYDMLLLFFVKKIQKVYLNSKFFNPSSWLCAWTDVVCHGERFEPLGWLRIQSGGNQQCWRRRTQHAIETDPNQSSRYPLSHLCPYDARFISPTVEM